MVNAQKGLAFLSESEELADGGDRVGRIRARNREATARKRLLDAEDFCRRSSKEEKELEPEGRIEEVDKLELGRNEELGGFEEEEEEEDDDDDECRRS